MDTLWLPLLAGCLGDAGLISLNIIYEMWGPHPSSPVPPISSPPHSTGTTWCCLRLFAWALLQDSKSSTDHSLKWPQHPNTLHVLLTPDFFMRQGLPTWTRLVCNSDSSTSAFRILRQLQGTAHDPNDLFIINLPLLA